MKTSYVFDADQHVAVKNKSQVFDRYDESSIRGYTLGFAHIVARLPNDESEIHVLVVQKTDPITL